MCTAKSFALKKLPLDNNRFAFKLDCLFKLLRFLDGPFTLSSDLDYRLEILKIWLHIRNRAVLMSGDLVNFQSHTAA